MTGDEQRRLCAQCDKHVHNLSALSPPKLQHFLEERDGTECIAYVLRDDGTMVSPPRWPRVFGILHRVRATAGWLLALMLPSVFAGCAQRWCAPSAGMMKGTPIPGRTRVSIEQKVDFPEDGKMLLGEAPTKRRGSTSAAARQ